MGNTAVKGYTDVWGKHGAAIYDHTGPASYVTGGEKLTPQSFNLRSIDWAESMRSSNGALSAIAVSPPGGGGNATSITLLWQYSGTTSVASVSQNAAGVGMTPGVTVPIAFSAPAAGGTQATGTLTVLTATTFSSIITNPGSGYASAPTATVAGTGGTPPTLTSNLSTSGSQPAAGTNLSGVSVRIIAIGG
jgi:hypothetical protein